MAWLNVLPKMAVGSMLCYVELSIGSFWANLPHPPHPPHRPTSHPPTPPLEVHLDSLPGRHAITGRRWRSHLWRCVRLRSRVAEPLQAPRKRSCAVLFTFSGPVETQSRWALLPLRAAFADSWGLRFSDPWGLRLLPLIGLAPHLMLSLS